MKKKKYNFKGTKGKWIVSKNFSNEVCVEVVQSGWNVGKSFIAEEMGQENEYDAHLIANAPELLKACIAMVEACDKHNLTEVVPEHEIMMTAIHKALNIVP